MASRDGVWIYLAGIGVIVGCATGEVGEFDGGEGGEGGTSQSSTSQSSTTQQGVGGNTESGSSTASSTAISSTASSTAISSTASSTAISSTISSSAIATAQSAIAASSSSGGMQACTMNSECLVANECCVALLNICFDDLMGQVPAGACPNRLAAPSRASRYDNENDPRHTWSRRLIRPLTL
ncbi:MAG: hypothetical protein VB934_00210 [Polyangiaceae bacterium]